MKTIKRKILTPVLILAVAVPLATLVIFNISMRAYVYSAARQDLQNTLQTVRTLLKKELGIGIIDFSRESVQSAVGTIRTAALASEMSLYTDMLIFDGKGELLYPSDLGDGFVTAALAEKIGGNLSRENRGSVQSVSDAGKRYIYTYQRLLKAEIDRNPNIVFISSLNSADSLVAAINSMLAGMMLLGAAVSSLAAILLSNGISKKMKALCLAAERIGFQDYRVGLEKSDIREIEALSGCIGEMAGRLSAYDKAQKTFLQNASHEIRTPLMSIQGYAEAIENGVMPDAKKAAAVIGSESKRLNGLLEELLTLSRIESRTCVELRRADLGHCLQDYVQRLYGLTVRQDKQILLLLPKEPVSARIDDALFFQAVMNLVSNCVRYAKTAVTVVLAKENGRAVLRISDDGPGIPEEDLPHVFERFYKGKSGSFGLGLAIAKTAAETMGGTLAAYNRGGAVFEMRLGKAD